MSVWGLLRYDNSKFAYPIQIILPITVLQLLISIIFCISFWRKQSKTRSLLVHYTNRVAVILRITLYSTNSYVWNGARKLRLKIWQSTYTFPLYLSFWGANKGQKLWKIPPYSQKKKIIVPQKDSLPTIDSLAKYYSYSSENINPKNFEAVVYEIIQCYNKKDTTALNKLIHPDIGLYFLYKPGGDVYWANQKRIYLDTLYQEKEKTFIDGYNRKVLATGKIGVGKVPIEKITENIAPDEYSSLTGIFFCCTPRGSEKTILLHNKFSKHSPFFSKRETRSPKNLKKG